MSANENNSTNTIQNQEVYEGIREAMLQDGVIPREVIKYSEAMQEKKRLEELKDKLNHISDYTDTFNNAVESIDKQYLILSPITTPIKIITKRIDGMFKIIDLILEYQINGSKGVLIKIGEEIIAEVVFLIGTTISSIIATKVALALSAVDGDFGVVVGFFVFSCGVIVSDWLANKSKELVFFVYEHIYLPTKDTYINLNNSLDYFLSVDWLKEFIKLILFNNIEGKKVLEHELINKYGDEVDDMDNFEKDYRMLLGR